MPDSLETPPTQQNARRTIGVLAVVSVLTILAAMLSLSVGPKSIGFSTFVDALLHYNPANDCHLVVRDIRLPRAVLALIVGGSLAVAGAVMQGVTGNPLAGPSIMGLNAGATFCLLVGLLAMPRLCYNEAIGLSLLGAALGYGSVYAVGLMSRGGFTPVRIALAGAVVSALLGSLTQGLTIYFSLHDEMLFWTAGGIANVTWDQVVAVGPFFVVGMAGALWIAPSVTVLSLGEEVAIGLGQQTRRTRGVATACVLLLTGSATAVAGPVGFVGLMVPHVGRLLVGTDYRRLIPLAALLGACLTVTADIGARTAGSGQEVPLGLFTTMAGAPFFVWLTRQYRRSGQRNGSVSATNPKPARAGG